MADPSSPDGEPSRFRIIRLFMWLTVHRPHMIRMTGLVAAGCCMAVSGSTVAFNAYANSVKKTYNITQSHVESIASMSWLGMCLVYPAGLMLEKIGPTFTLLFGAGLTSLTFFLLWTSTLMRIFYHIHFYLLYIYFFVTGFASVFGYITGLTIPIANFSSRQRGFIIALLDSCFSIGVSLFAAFYGLLFVKGHVTDEEHQDLGGFYMFNGILFLAVFVIGAVLVRPVKVEDTLDPEASQLIRSDNADPDNESIERPLEDEQDLTGWPLFKNLEFQFMLWAFIFIASIHVMFFYNIPTYLKSFKMEKYNTLYTVATPLIIVITKLLMGCASDRTITRVPRVAYHLVANVVQTCVLFFAIFYSDNMFVFAILNLATAISDSAVFCLTPAIMSELFGTRYFSRNWGYLYLGLALGAFLLQEMFGYFYDILLPPDSLTCFGAKCFQKSFLIVTILSFFSVVLNILSLEWRMHIIQKLWHRFVSNR